MRNEEIVLLVVLGIGVLFFFWLCLGGSKDAEEEANRIDQKASYLQYKLSLWYRTEKIKRSYRYWNCKNCERKCRTSRKEKDPMCPYCNAPLNRKERV